LYKISLDARNTLFKGHGVSSDFPARKRAAVEINCDSTQSKLIKPHVDHTETTRKNKYEIPKQLHICLHKIS